jgi:hypothetical protein
VPLDSFWAPNEIKLERRDGKIVKIGLCLSLEGSKFSDKKIGSSKNKLSFGLLLTNNAFIFINFCHYATHRISLCFVSHKAELFVA